MLVQALANARGPSRDLDFDIFVWLNPQFASDEWRRTIGGFRHRYDSSDDRCLPNPAHMPLAYTSKVDHAMTLIPQHLKIAELKDGIKDSTGEFCFVSLWCPTDPTATYDICGYGATPALAICQAAIKARTQQHSR